MPGTANPTATARTWMRRTTILERVRIVLPPVVVVVRLRHQRVVVGVVIAPGTPVEVLLVQRQVARELVGVRVVRQVLPGLTVRVGERVGRVGLLPRRGLRWLAVRPVDVTILVVVHVDGDARTEAGGLARHRAAGVGEVVAAVGVGRAGEAEDADDQCQRDDETSCGGHARVLSVRVRIRLSFVLIQLCCFGSPPCVDLADVDDAERQREHKEDGQGGQPVRAYAYAFGVEPGLLASLQGGAVKPACYFSNCRVQVLTSLCNLIPVMRSRGKTIETYQ